MNELSENDIANQIEEAMWQAQIEMLNNNTLVAEDVINTKLTDRFYQLEWGGNLPILKLQNVNLRQEEIYLSDLDNSEEKEKLVLNFIEKTRADNTVDLPDYISERKKLLIGLGLVTLGYPSIKKPRSGIKGLLGSRPNTSQASILSRKLIPPKYQLRFNGKQIRIFGTSKIGGIVGRGIPVVGWGLIAWDVVEITWDLAEAYKESMNEYFEKYEYYGPFY